MWVGFHVCHIISASLSQSVILMNIWITSTELLTTVYLWWWKRRTVGCLASLRKFNLPQVGNYHESRVQCKHCKVHLCIMEHPNYFHANHNLVQSCQHWFIELHRISLSPPWTPPELSLGTIPYFPKIWFFFSPCHNFFPLSSVQINIIPACCLLCVL